MVKQIFLISIKARERLIKLHNSDPRNQSTYTGSGKWTRCSFDLFGNYLFKENSFILIYFIPLSEQLS